MKSLLAGFLLCLLGSVASAQTAPSFDQQRAASSAAVLQKYPDARVTGSHLTRCADKLYLEWQAKNDWRLTTPQLPLYLWESAEIQRQLEVRLAQIRATSYVTPAPAPVSTSPSLPGSKSGAATVIHSAGQGVYTTHGGAAGGATILQTVPGVWEVRRKDGAIQRVLKP